MTDVVRSPVTRGTHPFINCAARSAETTTNSNDPMPLGG
jgi:hypothetical protein